MNNLKCQELYLINDLKNYINTTAKYKFGWTTDICWEERDFKDNGVLINKYYDEEDIDKFIDLYNSVYANKYFNVKSINIMKGPGAGWPEAKIETDFITVKELIDADNKELDVGAYYIINEE